MKRCANRCPLYPQKRTSVEPVGMSALCQKRTFCAAAQKPLFDHLVGGNEQVGRYIEAKCLGSLEIDSRLEPCRSLNWQISWFVTTQDAVDIRGSQPKQVVLIGPVRHEAAGHDEGLERVDRRQAVPSSERDDEIAMDDGTGVWR